MVSLPVPGRDIIEKSHREAKLQLKAAEESFAMRNPIEEEQRNTCDTVTISLEKYDEMRDRIRELEDVNNSLERKYDNLCAFINDISLPGEIIANGFAIDIKCEKYYQPMSCQVQYIVKVTVDERMVQ